MRVIKFGLWVIIISTIEFSLRLLLLGTFNNIISSLFIYLTGLFWLFVTIQAHIIGMMKEITYISLAIAIISLSSLNKERMNDTLTEFSINKGFKEYQEQRNHFWFMHNVRLQ